MEFVPATHQSAFSWASTVFYRELCGGKGLSRKRQNSGTAAGICQTDARLPCIEPVRYRKLYDKETLVRCARCGNENPGQNRFCGMCGATLLAPPAPKAAEPQVAPVAPTAAQVVTAPAPVSEAPRSATSVSEVPTSISGPSFLGLNDPAPRQPAARRRASMSIDPHSAAGSNLEYLLDEEEPQHHWGIGKILLILIALALAVSFGYLRWKNQGFAWLNLSKKPAVAQNSPGPDATAQSPSSSSPAITPDTQAPGGATTSQPATATPGATAPEGNTAGTPTAAPTPTPSGPSTAMPADNSKPTDKTPPDA